MLVMLASYFDALGDQAIIWLGSVFGDVTSVKKFLQIVGLNIVLSGDNAVVIALACRNLPARQKFWGIFLGALAAVVLRIVFTVLLQYIQFVPYLKIVGGLLLLWIAVKMLMGEEADEDSIAGKSSLMGAIQTVAIADMVMSLDNVLAIAAVAGDNIALTIAGLAISIPLIVAGAALITSLLHRFPILVWAGAALLGWVAGELFLTDMISKPVIFGLGQGYGLSEHAIEYVVQGACAAFVVLAGLLLMAGRRKEA